nr:immunoglobulin light chain junction region [Macaca mulatta]
CQQYIISPSSF